jgi:hypothetical protein
MRVYKQGSLAHRAPQHPKQLSRSRIIPVTCRYDTRQSANNVAQRRSRRERRRDPSGVLDSEQHAELTRTLGASFVRQLLLLLLLSGVDARCKLLSQPSVSC